MAYTSLLWGSLEPSLLWGSLERRGTLGCWSIQRLLFSLCPANKNSSQPIGQSIAHFAGAPPRKSRRSSARPLPARSSVIYARQTISTSSERTCPSLRKRKRLGAPDSLRLRRARSNERFRN